MDKILTLLLIFVAGCSYLTQESGMTEWDYKMYKDGWQLEYIDEDKKDMRWTSGNDTYGTNSSDN